MTVEELLKGKEELAKARRVLADFYRAPLSMASVQPILDLAVELNPELKEPRRERRAYEANSVVVDSPGDMKVTK